MKKIFFILEISIIAFLLSCNKEDEVVAIIQQDNIIDVCFSISNKKRAYNDIIAEDLNELKKLNKEHSIKYYSYIPSEVSNANFSYYDVMGNKREMIINDNVDKHNYIFDSEDGVFSRISPIGYNMSYGIDISRHNGIVDFDKVKQAGFDFVFIRIAYRGYGKKGNLKQDEKYIDNIKLAKERGLKVGVYVFSQAKNEIEALEEADFALSILGNERLDLAIVYDIETIKNNIARTDNLTGEQMTKNAIAFMDRIKLFGYETAFYSNMVFEDYYFDMEKLNNYDVWYADYNKKPQTPYDFKYWQFSDRGLVDGVMNEVDLNVMFTTE